MEGRPEWGEIALPKEQVARLRTLCGLLRSRRRQKRGAAVLFHGPGAGKLEAAQALGQELGVQVSRVDLAGVVSKYVGETEKNLSRIFDAAEAQDVVLLLDEADALFGKRAEVKDSHVRYADVAVSYLLQRMEGSRSLCVLVTSTEGGLPEGLRRRIAMQLHFPASEEPVEREES